MLRIMSDFFGFNNRKRELTAHRKKEKYINLPA